MLMWLSYKQAGKRDGNVQFRLWNIFSPSFSEERDTPSLLRERDIVSSESTHFEIQLYSFNFIIVTIHFFKQVHARTSTPIGLPSVAPLFQFLWRMHKAIVPQDMNLLLLQPNRSHNSLWLKHVSSKNGPERKHDCSNKKLNTNQQRILKSF
jgi:hypothetical protein